MSRTKKTFSQQASMLRLPVLIALMAIVFLTSCRIEVNGANGDHDRRRNFVTRSVPVSSFTAVKLTSSVDVKYVPSDTFAVILRGPKSYIDQLVVKVENGALYIGEKEHADGITIIGFVHDDDDVKVIVKAPKINNVAMYGSGSFECDGTMRSESLTLSIAGSGDIDVKNIEASSVSAEVAGSGDIEAMLTGVRTTNVRVAGSGDVDFKFRRCGDVNAKIAGSGDVSLSGRIESLSQNVAGSGEIDTEKLTVAPLNQ